VLPVEPGCRGFDTVRFAVFNHLFQYCKLIFGQTVVGESLPPTLELGFFCHCVLTPDGAAVALLYGTFSIVTFFITTGVTGLSEASVFVVEIFITTSIPSTIWPNIA